MIGNTSTLPLNLNHSFYPSQWEASVVKLLYCTTAPLDGYVTLPARTPHTRTMMSHSICSKDFCNPWYTHPKEYYLPSVHLLLSGLVSIRIGSVRAAHHGQSVPLAIVHGYRNLIPTCGTYYCRRNMEDAVEETD